MKDKKTLKNLREIRKLTQRELSDDMQIPISSIAMYERGYRIPSLKRATKIAEYFNVPVEDIFFGEETHERILRGEKHYKCDIK